MKTVIRLAIPTMILSIFLISCQKGEFPVTGENELSVLEKNELTFDFPSKTKKKILKAVDFGKEASLEARSVHRSLVFDNRIWILGGINPYGSKDVLFSEDGVNWKDLTEKANFPERYHFGATVFQDKMWIAGGFGEYLGPGTGGYERNDVWSTENGIHWKEVTSNAGFSRRVRNTLTAFNGSLWLIGGDGYNWKTGIPETYADVWRSSDGVTWFKVTENAPFGKRRSHAAVVYDNKLWVIGGSGVGIENDVWYTENGYHWIQATDYTAFSPRVDHTLTTDGKLMWLMAGTGVQDNKKQSVGPLNDIWYSANGVDWYKAGTTLKIPQRTQHASVFFGGKLWVIHGSRNGTLLSDIWSFEDPDYCCDEIDDWTSKK